MIYTYEAFKRDGTKVSGTVQAETPSEAEQQLYQQNLLVSEIAPLIKSRGVRFFKKEDLLHMTRLLATAVQAKLPLARALEIIMAEFPIHNPFHHIILSLLNDIKSGKSFSVALANFPKVFEPFYVNMVKSGEKTGKMEQPLFSVLDYLQSRYDTTKKINTALIYPGFILGFAIVVLIFFISFIIPRFEESFQHLGGSLPAFTAAILGISLWVKNHLLLLIGGGVITGILFSQAYKTDRGRKLFERFVFLVPVVGSITIKNILSIFARTLSVLLSNGVPLLEALELVYGMVQNKNFEVTIQKSIQDLSQGRSFTEALKDNKYIPQMMVQMSAMGEETGSLAELLNNLSGFYEKDVESSVEKLTALLTPALIVLVGIIIGTIIIGLYLPIFNLSDITK